MIVSMTENSISSQEESASRSDATSDTREWDPTWPAVDIMVLPGMPGWAGPRADLEVANPYPSSTSDFVKALRLEGLSVGYTVNRDDRSTVSLKAAEIWVPILFFALQDVAQVPSEILTAAILKVFGRWISDDSRLHVHFMQKSPDGYVQEFRSDGRASDVLRAMKVFGETHKSTEDPST